MCAKKDSFCHDLIKRIGEFCNNMWNVVDASACKQKHTCDPSFFVFFFYGKMTSYARKVFHQKCQFDQSSLRTFDTLQVLLLCTQNKSSCCCWSDRVLTTQIHQCQRQIHWEMDQLNLITLHKKITFIPSQKRQLDFAKELLWGKTSQLWSQIKQKILQHLKQHHQGSIGSKFKH